VPSEGDRRRLLEALSVTPTTVDTLIGATGLSASTVQTSLLELDLAGRIEWSGRQLVALRQ
jgi:DNA processing protein